MSKRFVFQHVGFATVRKGLLDVFSMNLKLEIPCVPRSASMEPVPERFSLMKCSVDRALPIEQLLAATGTKLYSGLLWFVQKLSQLLDFPNRYDYDREGCLYIYTP